jgi:hypothetical protein
MSRLFVLGTERGKEWSAIQEGLTGKEFSCAYTGGEIFPQISEDGKITNLLQNTSLIVCVF